MYVHLLATRKIDGYSNNCLQEVGPGVTVSSLIVVLNVS